jgi:XTP/dITP diphosphohydrolase
MTLYAATSNPGKLREFTAAAHPHNIAIEPLPNLAQIPEPIEDAPTFLGNAELKAVAYSLTLPHALVFADDSGLAVDVLDGRPGVRSARFADDGGFAIGQGSTDERNNRRLLMLMPGRGSRNAHFHCALALARNGEILLRAEAAVKGELLHRAQGDAGFGYDPLFLIPHLNQTFAELPPETKWQLSHRGQAFRNLLDQLPTLNLPS